MVDAKMATQAECDGGASHSSASGTASGYLAQVLVVEGEGVLAGKGRVRPPRNTSKGRFLRFFL